jgi:GWxTD domain-containing protein
VPRVVLFPIIRIAVLLSPIVVNESLLGQNAPILNNKDYDAVSMKVAPESQYHHCFESLDNEKKAIGRLPTIARDWLDEDAVYIITPEERCAFLHLETDEERTWFIEQFWNRRTFHPVSLGYDFKVEHYRRIVEANEKYGVGSGWKTDRGKVYVLFGSPDSVDVKEGPGNTELPFHPLETWHYHYVRGLGESVQFDFTYQAAYGDYRLPEAENDMLARADPNPDGFAETPDVPDSRLPQVRFKDLEAIVTSQLVHEQVKFSHRIDFFPATKATTLVRIEIQIPCETCARAGQIVPSLAYPVFIRVFEESGRVVSTSELTADIAVAKSDSKFSVAPHQDVPLAPGMYELAVVTRNPVTNEAGVVRIHIDVPTYEALKMKN